jgi:hypothetical protein
MNRPLLLFPLLLAAFICQGQVDNPFESIGKKGKVLTLSNGKYAETFDYDSVQRIGTVLINIRSRKIVRLLKSESTFHKYSDNSAASRWWSQDALATKYPEFSPYVYVTDNPIRFNDPDGRDLVDPNGKHVAVTVNKDGTVKLGKNANADLVRLVTGMAKTEIGRTVLHSMIDSKTHISMQIDKEHVIMNKDGTMRAGVTQPIISQQTINGTPVGDKYISSAKITVYEAAVNRMADEHDGKQSFNGVTFDIKSGPITMEDVIASVGVHEGTHATDRGSSASLNPKATMEQTEKKPYANQILFLQQIQQQANQSNDNSNGGQ